jgi:hypothetical protein
MVSSIGKRGESDEYGDKKVHKRRRGRRVGEEMTHGCANREGALHRGNFEVQGKRVAERCFGRNIPGFLPMPDNSPLCLFNNLFICR